MGSAVSGQLPPGQRVINADQFEVKKRTQRQLKKKLSYASNVSQAMSRAMSSFVSEGAQHRDNEYSEKNLVIQVGKLKGSNKLISKIFVRISLCRREKGGSQNHTVVAQVRTAYVYNTQEPGWFSYIPLSEEARAHDRVLLEVFTCHTFIARTCLGKCEVSVEDLDGGSYKSLSLKLSQPKYWPPLELDVRRIFGRSAANRKRIFFVRHGESVWNNAVANNNILQMVSARDHPLNQVGVNQAMKFRGRFEDHHQTANEDDNHVVQIIDTNKKTSFESSFWNAQKVYSSPLCRALQTALIGLSDHPCVVENGIKLLGSVREVKKLGSIDCYGSVFGQASVDRACDALKMVVKNPTQEETSVLEKIDVLKRKVNVHNTDNEWSKTLSESKQSVAERLREFLVTVQYSSASTVVVVTHSLFLREFFGAMSFAVADDETKNLVLNLEEKKIGNCSCVGVDVEFAQDWPSCLDLDTLAGYVDGIVDEPHDTDVGPSPLARFVPGPCSMACIVDAALLWDGVILERHH